MMSDHRAKVKWPGGLSVTPPRPCIRLDRLPNRSYDASCENRAFFRLIQIMGVLNTW